MKLPSVILLVCLCSLLALPTCKSKENLKVEVVEPDEPVAVVPDSVFKGPLIITAGGKYTGNYKSLDSKVPAIYIYTTEPVEITGCLIASAGDLIKCVEATNLNIHHNNFFGLPPNNNEQWGRVINVYRPHTMVFEHNFVEHTGGILLDHRDTSATAAVNVTIRYNIIRNTDKRKSDLTGGEERSVIQFNTVSRVGGEISWNQFENLPNRSFLLHNINLYNSGGVSGQPYLIHDNYVKGAYPFPLNANYYVGSGITVDGDPSTNTMETMSQFVNAYNNQVISTCNAGMNIAAGHDIHFYNNTIISSGKYSNGASSDRFWSGCSMWNAAKVPVGNFINNDIKANNIGYVSTDRVFPAPVRQDFVVVPDNVLSVGPNDNKALPNPITLDVEKAELTKWKAKLAANNITLGNMVK
ncbi:MAG: hypothetical protein WKF89_13610 [Chitinophagaceae bacterium]